jgi:hypothetical protein
MSNFSGSEAPAQGESTPAARPDIHMTDRAARANEQRTRFKDLSPEHMPSDYSISLDAYRRGGTDTFLDRRRPAPILRAFNARDVSGSQLHGR